MAITRTICKPRQHLTPDNVQPSKILWKGLRNSFIGFDHLSFEIMHCKEHNLKHKYNVTNTVFLDFLSKNAIHY